MKVKLFILCITTLFLLPLQNPLFAQTDQKLDDALEGFHDEENSGGELQEVMEGFEDNTPAGVEPFPQFSALTGILS
jgi:hypothetical protein